jgi:maleylpyruvate isomerase
VHGSPPELLAWLIGRGDGRGLSVKPSRPEAGAAPIPESLPSPPPWLVLPAPAKLPPEPPRTWPPDRD